LAKADTAFQAHPSVNRLNLACLETHNAALAEYIGRAALVYALRPEIPLSAGWLPQRRLTRDH
jgi:hypothetical protein